ncbi:cyclic di-GMP phosphodiesterase response regulator RpfG [Desulfosporosinus acididurans]|uniref:Cyclic di-GMP phosphodiesterase response regulator RpfG n=1 Tax=Desulfosporosinus acididurans TaxID=476652 RepID=A0A0J1FMR0_9FIRM|nr:HD domain-containing phosphohydrolase [Desulfosporosinus acididurans]KLU64263.1 cyclic di-GMP phosphodiesterase response regulator RpfG [Desulfosporosinus acididurans]
MSGKIKQIIDEIIFQRSRGNPAIAEMTKAKFILKGINPNQYDNSSIDDPIIIERLLKIAKELNINTMEEELINIKPVYSTQTTISEAVSEIKRQLLNFKVKLLIFFGSSSFDYNKLSACMQEAFDDCIVIGCSTAGEIVNGKFLKNSVVAMAFNSKIISDAKVEVIEHLQNKLCVEGAFKSFEKYFNLSSSAMNPREYVGIVLIDGLSMKQEKIMDKIGDRTNVYFIGGSAGDDLKYVKTHVCANGKAYTDSAVLLLLRMSPYAEFNIIKTQSFKALDHVLIADKVNEETREVIEFNHKPAILAYADAIGVKSIEEATKYFLTHPVGLVIGEKEILVRSPRETRGTNIKFDCSILEGMEVRLLESTNIIEDTKTSLNNIKADKIEGIINFQCIKRTLELEKKGLLTEYRKIFNDIPNVGFSSYGELFIGHLNQTAAMLVFKSKDYNYYRDLNSREIKELIDENRNLHKRVMELNQQLEETTADLKQFNIMLEEEIYNRIKKEDEIRYLSYHDKLTGLYNRRFYEEEIRRLDSERNLPLSIIMGDVNGLKLVNDTFGHEKGDELLLKVAGVIRKACRTDDIVARWGGDEFIFLLPRTNSDEAGAIVQRIKNQCSDEQVNTICISISFGWATKKEPSEDIFKTLKVAEDYMYKNKILDNQNNIRDTITTIINTLHEKSPREEQHSKRVSELCQSIGVAMGLSEIEINKIKVVGLLHDIGKIAIEEGILNKPGRLTKQERIEIERHPEIGYRILNSSNYMLDIADCILAHHERWDGTGYPKGLKGETIPKFARIISLADAYDAMTSERSYRSALSETMVIEELRSNAGLQFDPELTRLFIEKILNKSCDKK